MQQVLLPTGFFKNIDTFPFLGVKHRKLTSVRIVFFLRTVRTLKIKQCAKKDENLFSLRTVLQFSQKNQVYSGSGEK